MLIAMAKMLRVALVVTVIAAVAILSGCSRIGSGFHRPYVRRGDPGFKPVDQVAPHARAMVQGKMSLADCLKQPESIADGGAGCLRAIKDIPVSAP
jgi:hypothetical protein